MSRSRIAGLGADAAAAAAAGVPQSPCYQLERVKGFLREAQDLTPDDLQAVVVTLQQLISTTAPLYDTYKVPADMDLIIFQLHGGIRMPSIQTEPQSEIGYLNLVPTERWLMKAQNCTIRVENIDRHHVFTDQNDVTMASIMPPSGYPVVFPPESPGIVPANENLRATFTLQDSSPATLGNPTWYQLIVTGVLVPRKG